MKKLLLFVFCMFCMQHPLSAATMQDSVEIVFSDSVVKPVQSGGDKRSLRKPPKAYLCNQMQLEANEPSHGCTCLFA